MLTIERITTDLFDANAYLVSSSPEKPALVVDPGPGAARVLKDQDRPIGAVLLTHGHPDHTWDAAAVSELGNGAPVFLPAPDREWLTDPAAKLGFGSFGQWSAPVALDVPMGDWEVLPGITLRAIPAPGHSRGSMVVLIGQATQAGSPAAFSGDVIFKGSVGRTDLPGGDQAEMNASLRTIAMALDPSTVLLPGHGEQTLWQSELESNFYVKEALKN